jgi:heat-inducible transcriptional repressor
MQTTLEVAEQAFDSEVKDDFVIAGQENLLELDGLEDIRELFKAFSLKGDILHLLDRCLETEGVQLFIGQESGYELLDECSVVTSPYKVDGELVGVLGVIGPTRMAYERVIPIVDATARVLSAALDSSRR